MGTLENLEYDARQLARKRLASIKKKEKGLEMHEWSEKSLIIRNKSLEALKESVKSLGYDFEKGYKGVCTIKGV